MTYEKFMDTSRRLEVAMNEIIFIQNLPNTFTPKLDASLQDAKMSIRDASLSLAREYTNQLKKEIKNE